jgi:hypothetical protein
MGAENYLSGTSSGEQQGSKSEFSSPQVRHRTWGTRLKPQGNFPYNSVLCALCPGT